MFTVEIRTTCKTCEKPLEKGFRTFCGKTCRNKSYTKKYKTKRLEWQRKRSGAYAENKRQCLVCGRWYIQVGSHVIQRHHFTAREYKELYDLPLKSGIIPEWFKELKGKQALENGTFHNLEKGARFRFVKDDPRAKIVSGWKGRNGSKGYTED